MDDRTRVAEAVAWILNHAEALNLKINNFQWNVPGLNLVDCSVTYSINGEELKGRGSAQTEELALIKAFCEGLDRFAFYQTTEPNTNGFAAHTSQEQAILNAQCELAERDAFLSHYFTETPFLDAPLDLRTTLNNDPALDYLDSNKVAYKILQMTSPQDAHCYLFLANGLHCQKPFGLALGGSCHPNPTQALRSAAIEGLRHVVSSLNGQADPSLNIDEFSDFSTHGPEDHIRLSSDLDYASNFIDKFWTPVKKQSDSPYYLADIPTTTQPLNIFTDSPFWLAQAKFHSLQSLFFGPSTPQQINFTRLTQFKGEPVSCNSMRTIPHPFG